MGDMDHSTYMKRFYSIVCGGACVLLAMVWIFIKHGLSPRGFGVAVLIWWIAMFAMIFALIRSRQRSAEDFRRQQIAQGASADVLDRDRCVSNIRRMKRLIVVFAILLGYGLLTTQGQPLLPRLVGVMVDVVILGTCAHTLYRSKKRLQELDSNRA